MNILAVDTSTKKANVYLEYSNKVIDRCIDNEITHSEKLLPLINEVLNTEKASLKQVDYLACCAGPGSFTGIRIGIATVKAFAKAIDVPVFNVSSLDILAYTNTSADYIISIMDAKNLRIYYSIYKVNKQLCGNIEIPYLEKICDYSNDTIDIALEKIQTILSNHDLSNTASVNIIGDCVDNYKELFINTLNTSFKTINTYSTDLSAGVLAQMLKNYIVLGIEKNYIQNYLTLDAIYVRPSQAERAKNNEL